MILISIYYNILFKTKKKALNKIFFQSLSFYL